MTEEVLQIAEKRKEVKGKGEKERYTHLKAEFQRKARRDKKAFLSAQCKKKKIEESNKMGKTRDLKKIRDNKGTFHAKMGTIKNRNGMDLTEAERGGICSLSIGCLTRDVLVLEPTGNLVMDNGGLWEGLYQGAHLRTAPSVSLSLE